MQSMGPNSHGVADHYGFFYIKAVLRGPTKASWIFLSCRIVSNLNVTSESIVDHLVGLCRIGFLVNDPPGGQTHLLGDFHHQGIVVFVDVVSFAHLEKNGGKHS